MRRLAQEAQSPFSGTRLGEITSYNPATYSAKVMIQPDGYETGWLPIMAAMIGQGWGLLAAPSIGDHAVVSFEHGDPESGLVMGFIPSDAQRPGAPPSGELWLTHQTGSTLKLTNDGKVLVSANTDLTLTAAGKVIVNSTGDTNLTVGGQLNATVTGKAVVTASEIDLVGNTKVTGNLDVSAILRVGGVTVTVP